MLLLLLLLQDWGELRSQLDKLADDDIAVRTAARDVKVSKELLHKAPREHRETAALALGLLGDAKAKDTLVEMSKNASTRAIAFEALGGLKVDGRIFLEALSEEARVAFAAARGLARTDLERLKRAFDDADRHLLENRSPERIKRRLAAAMGIDPAKYPYVIRKAIIDADPSVAAFGIVAALQLDPVLAATIELGPELKSARGRDDLEAGLRESAAILAIRLGAEQDELVLMLKDPSAAVRAKALEAFTPSEPLPHDVGRWLEITADASLDAALRTTLEGWIAKTTGVEGRDAWIAWWAKNRYSSIFSSADKAAARGATWLQSQSKKGVWEERYRGRVGLTALAAYTMLKCGLKAEDSISFLAGEDPHGESGEGGTYRAAAMALAFSEAREMKSLEAVAKYLQGAQHRDGSWGYHEGDKEHADTSNTQMALVGLRAAANAGIKIPPAVFTRAADWLRRTQLKDGGWPYTKEESYPAMTAAGLCALLMAKPDGAKEADAARAWLAEHWVVEGARPAKGQYLYMSVGDDPMTSQLAKGTGSPFVTTNYWLWCLERACMASGTEKIGDHDWFAEGAALLFRKVDRQGRWKGPLGIADHCFALLFLKRAYVPVPSEQK